MKLGLPEGTPVAVGAFDAHLGAIGAGIGPGVLVKIMGTSTCDIMVSPSKENMADIPGLCGIVPESVLPDHFGLEAGQSAVGDIFNWVVNFTRGNADAISHESLTAAAEKLQPGESALLALDWHNGNRTVLVDQRLTGTIVGLSLHTTPAEVYRAMLEATAFGSRMIVERVEEYGVKVQRVVNCGGIATRNPLTMQIYADVFNRPVAVSRSTQTCALGAAIAGAVVAGKSRGGHANFADAIAAMTGVQEKIFVPNPARAAIYERLFALYRKLHDAFGIRGTCIDLSNVMKELLDIRDACRSN
jgi:L-ribulokinase